MNDHICATRIVCGDRKLKGCGGAMRNQYWADIGSATGCNEYVCDTPGCNFSPERVKARSAYNWTRAYMGTRAAGPIPE